MLCKGANFEVHDLYLISKFFRTNILKNNTKKKRLPVLKKHNRFIQVKTPNFRA